MIDKKSKPLGQPDNSGFYFTQEMLDGDFISGINFDFLLYDKINNKYKLFELLLCEENQSVNPWTSHPNRYWNKNKQKFISLFNASLKLEADLLLVNYAKKDTEHEDKVLLLKVLSIDQNRTNNWIETQEIKYTRKEFSKILRIYNNRCF